MSSLRCVPNNLRNRKSQATGTALVEAKAISTLASLLSSSRPKRYEPTAVAALIH
jgi:hypothetical protein